MSPIERARSVILAEAEAIRLLADRIDARFEQAVQLLLALEGRAVTTGIGKAGAIARKSAATLASTGTPALYMHPAEGLHGDLGVVTSSDVVIAFSYSGESEEVVRLLPTLRLIQSQLIAIVGAPSSSLAAEATVVLDVAVRAEACPLGLAPSSSVAAMLAMSDALALTVMEARGFTRENFALYHPAGLIGKRLTVHVSDVMRTGNRMAVVPVGSTLREAGTAITTAKAGAACVLDDHGLLVGLVTDGDLRRASLAHDDAMNRFVEEFMTHNPFVITGDPLAAEALGELEQFSRSIGEAPVVDTAGRPVGMVMLKDLTWLMPHKSQP